MNGRIARSVVGALVVATGLVVANSGPPSADAAEVTTPVPYTGPPVDIPDGSIVIPSDPATATIDVAGVQGNVIDVDLLIGDSPCTNSPVDPDAGISHGFDGDLEITLIAPDGTDVLVIDNVGGAAQNFCQTLLDDDAVAPNIQTALPIQAPFGGTWTPANPLTAFDGLDEANGTWTLQVQDTFPAEVGDIRAFAVIITTETNNVVGAVKTVTGDFVEGGQVTYEVALANTGNADSIDNPGAEFVDVLPAGLDLVSTTADTGAAAADLASNTVTWNGSVPSGGTVTVTIVATIAPGTGGTVIANQGTVNFDADVNGTNESTVLTDNAAGGTVDPTTFTVTATQVTTTTTTTAPSATTTTAPSATSTTAPSATSTTAPSATTDTAAPSATSTTAPSATTDTAAASADTLPRTGGQFAGTRVSLALGLVLIGGGLVLLGTRIRRGNRFTRT